MASIRFSDLALSEALDRDAMKSVRGALGWNNFAFPALIEPVSIPGAVGMFNFFQQITNNVSNIGQQVDQTTLVNISNSGAGSTNNVIALPGLGNRA